MPKKLMAFAGRLGLVLFGLLTPILLLEIAVRVMGLAPPVTPNPNIWDLHPDLGWWHIPNSGGTFYSSYSEFSAEVQINSLGLRDDPALDSFEAADDRFKFLVLADSFGESLQVNLEETFFKQLQNRLSESGLPAQSINAGVGSWGTDQQLTYYRLEGHRFNPDLTLLFFFTRNDALNNYRPLELARNGGSAQKSFYSLAEDGSLIDPPPFDAETANANVKREPLPPAPLLGVADWLWVRSHLYRFVGPYLRDVPAVLQALGPSGILGGEGRVRATHPAVPVPFYVYQSPPPAEWEAAWELTEAIISRLRDEVEADGSRFGVVIIPAREQVYPEQWQRGVEANPALSQLSLDLTLPNQKLAQLLSRQQIAHLDLLPIFQTAAAEADTPPLYFAHDGHWTAAGHQVTAEAVHQFLQDSALLPAD